MRSTLALRNPAPLLRFQAAMAAKHFRPKVFGNALGNSIADGMQPGEQYSLTGMGAKFGEQRALITFGTSHDDASMTATSGFGLNASLGDEGDYSPAIGEQNLAALAPKTRGQFSTSAVVPSLDNRALLNASEIMADSGNYSAPAWEIARQEVQDNRFAFNKSEISSDPEHYTTPYLAQRDLLRGIERDTDAAYHLRESVAADLIVPGSPREAPAMLNFSAMQEGFEILWGNSFPNGASQEQGATIVSNPSGKLDLVNVASGVSKSFVPNLAVDPMYAIQGIVHTHPYDASEGGHTGISLSGGDAAYLVLTGQIL